MAMPSTPLSWRMTSWMDLMVGVRLDIWGNSYIRFWALAPVECARAATTFVATLEKLSATIWIWINYLFEDIFGYLTSVSWSCGIQLPLQRLQGRQVLRAATEAFDEFHRAAQRVERLHAQHLVALHGGYSFVGVFVQ